MPVYEDSTACRAPAVEVWKLLHDPSRFPEWWANLDRVEVTADGVARYMEAYPDFAYPTVVESHRDGARVTVSCLLSDIRHEWTLHPAESGCRIGIRVEVPDSEADRLAAMRDEVVASLPRLVAAAERSAGIAA